MKKKIKTETFGGASVFKVDDATALRRSVMTCMLWEDTHYENGQVVADRIKSLIPKVDPAIVADIAIKARNEQKMRHVPLFVLREMVRNKFPNVRQTMAEVIKRPDEIAEFMDMYWDKKRTPIANQVKLGLSDAFGRFNEYSLAKHDTHPTIKLRDVMFLVHPKPDAKGNGKPSTIAKLEKKGKVIRGEVKRHKNAILTKLAENTMAIPDTWEVEISKSKNKKESWERLLDENKLGVLALIRNLRNMTEANVDPLKVKKALSTVKTEWALPFRFYEAKKHAPAFEADLEQAMFKSLKNKLIKGKTIFVVDVSGSMGGSIAGKSGLSRMDAACALTVIMREVCENPVIYATAGNDSTCIHKTEKVDNKIRGFKLHEHTKNLSSPLGGGGIFLTQVMDYVKKQEVDADRIIVITDEQDCDHKNKPSNALTFGKTNYIINVGNSDKSITDGKWTSISGWSESVVDYIIETEKSI